MGGSEWALVEATADVITRETPVVDRPMLDAVAATVFRRAAIRLARERPQTDGATEAAREAAQALMNLAAIQDESALRQFLRPDPRVDETTWTVACYQIGDLTPCALLDFANPVAAVNSLSTCGEDSHVAAELVASTTTGTRWTALTRTGRAVSFQLPDGRSASDATSDQPGEISVAGRHWQDQLRRWASRDGADEVMAATPTSRPVKVPVAPHSAPRPAAAVRAPGLELEQALVLVVDTLRTMESRTTESRPWAGEPNDEVLSRLDALDQRMREVQATIEVALERRTQALANYAAELTRAFAAQQSATAARLEARLDELMARFSSQAEPAETTD